VQGSGVGKLTEHENPGSWMCIRELHGLCRTDAVVKHRRAGGQRRSRAPQTAVEHRKRLCNWPRFSPNPTGACPRCPGAAGPPPAARQGGRVNARGGASGVVRSVAHRDHIDQPRHKVHEIAVRMQRRAVCELRKLRQCLVGNVLASFNFYKRSLGAAHRKSPFECFLQSVRFANTRASLAAVFFLGLYACAAV